MHRGTPHVEVTMHREALSLLPHLDRADVAAKERSDFLPGFKPLFASFWEGLQCTLADRCEPEAKAGGAGLCVHHWLLHGGLQGPDECGVPGGQLQREAGQETQRRIPADCSLELILLFS
jgi:hypothetical protein